MWLMVSSTLLLLIQQKRLCGQGEPRSGINSDGKLVPKRAESEQDMLDLLELIYGRWNGGQTAPIGSYFNPRTMAIYQTTSDAVLPLDGTWIRIDPSGTQTFANIATTLNTTLNTTYTSGSFHAQGSSDLVQQPGTASDDA